MSTRGYIEGFDLAQLRSLLGSRDESVVAEATQFMEARYLSRVRGTQREQRLQAVRRVVAVVRRAVYEGVPLPDVARESPAHAEAARVLARLRQSPLPTAFADWKVHSVFPSLWADHASELPAADRHLLAHLVNGRPLLGQEVSDEQGYYASLDPHEVSRLSGALASLQATHPRLRGNGYHDGFVDDLVQALQEVQTRRRDLWFYAG